jgi:CcmD family protein
MTNMKRAALIIIFLFCCATLFAQPAQQPVEMADVMRSSGKIYVVIGVIAIVFVGLAIYLFSIDRRLRKIEREK